MQSLSKARHNTLAVPQAQGKTVHLLSLKAQVFARIFFLPAMQEPPANSTEHAHHYHALFRYHIRCRCGLTGWDWQVVDDRLEKLRSDRTASTCEVLREVFDTEIEDVNSLRARLLEV